MKKNLTKYIGVSCEKRKQKEAYSLGFIFTHDEYVLIGFVLFCFNYNLGLWLHKRDYIISAKTL